MRAGAGDIPVLGQRGRGHEERAGVDHSLDRGVADHEAVLDAVDPGVERGVDGGVAVGVGGDLEAAAVRLVGDDGELLGRVLLGTRRAGGRDHPTGARST